MTTQNPTPIPPDFEERHRFAVAVCRHLGIDPGQVDAGTLTVELGADHSHTVRWQSHDHITSDQLGEIMAQVRADCPATLHTGDARLRCTLKANHPLPHHGTDGSTWEPAS